MKSFLRWKLSGLWKDRFGGVMVYAAITAPVVIGIVGLSVDTGIWYAQKRLTQSAADSAAMAASLEVLRSDGDADAITAAAIADAANHGYNTSEVAVNFLGNNRVEVIVTRSTPGSLSQVIFTETTNVQARAVAEAAVNDGCVWSLNPSVSGAVRVSGGAEVNLGCGVISNSGDPSGIEQNGSACLTATKLKVVGGASGDCLYPQPIAGVPPVADPLAALEGPIYTPCTGGGPPNNCNGNQDCTFNPGLYCTNINITTNGTATFNPGLYILDAAALSIGGQSTVNGIDVSFYLTENGGPNDDITIAGGANVTLSAPSNGDLPGILFYQDRNATGNITHNLTGGATMQIEGIVYFPSVDIAFSGGSALQSSAAIIIADEVSFTGDAFMGGFENSPILGNPLLTQARLVE